MLPASVATTFADLTEDIGTVGGLLIGAAVIGLAYTWLKARFF